MTVKLVALYKKTEDQLAFDTYYQDTHAPLAKKLPGMISMEIQRVLGAPMGHSPYHLLVQMSFETRDALNKAMASSEGMAAAKDVMGFAGNLITMMITEVAE